MPVGKADKKNFFKKHAGGSMMTRPRHFECFYLVLLIFTPVKGGPVVAIGAVGRLRRVGIGAGAGYNVDDVGNTYIGRVAGYAIPTGASYNTGIGAYSMSTNYYPPEYDNAQGGTENVALGDGSLGQIKTASMNTSVGGSAGVYIQTGSSNTFLGWRAGMGIVTGQNNIFIGASADSQAPLAGIS